MARHGADNLANNCQDEGGCNLLVDRVLAAMQTNPDAAQLHEKAELLLAELGHSEFFQGRLLRAEASEHIVMESVFLLLQRFVLSETLTLTARAL